MKTESILKDSRIRNAIKHIAARSDQQTDETILLKSFYDDNITASFYSPDSQLLLGRRGTGKTHVFRVLKHDLENESCHCIYFDCRTLGSARSTMDETTSLYSCTVHFIKDFILQLVADLRRHFSPLTFDPCDPCNYQHMQNYIDQIQKACDATLNHISEIVKEQESTDSQTSNKESGGEITPFSPSTPKILFSRYRTTGITSSNKTTEKVLLEENIVFPDILSPLRELTDYLNIRLFLFIDEWSSIPYEMQPHFSQFLKKAVFPCNRISVKIASVPNRSNFLQKQQNTIYGLELGADFFCPIDLDQLFIFDRTPERVVSFMFEMLSNHLSAELGSLPEGEKYRNLLFSAFQTPAAIYYLVRAAEGNARDFIRIFDRCIQLLEISLDSSFKITNEIVFSAAKFWFDTDKYFSLSPAQKTFYDNLVDYVASKKETRGFFVDEEALGNPFIQELIDLRTLHIMETGLQYPVFGAKRLTVILLDFGSYSSFIQRGKNLDLFYGDVYEKICRLVTPPEKTYSDYWDFDAGRKIRNVFIEFDSENRILGSE